MREVTIVVDETLPGGQHVRMSQTVSPKELCDTCFTLEGLMAQIYDRLTRAIDRRLWIQGSGVLDKCPIFWPGCDGSCQL